LLALYALGAVAVTLATGPAIAVPQAVYAKDKGARGISTGEAIELIASKTVCREISMSILSLRA